MRKIGSLIRVAWPRRIGLERDDSICELGCGSGAFLWGLRDSCPFIEMTGIDYSKGLLDIARGMLPQGDFRLGDLRSKNVVKGQYQDILAHGVVHYLKRNDALDLLSQCFGHSNQTVAVFDIPNLESRASAEAVRAAEMDENEYQLKYAGLTRTYFAWDDFAEICPDNWELRRGSCLMPNYKNGPFGFSAIFSRSE